MDRVLHAGAPDQRPEADRLAARHLQVPEAVRPHLPEAGPLDHQQALHPGGAGGQAQHPGLAVDAQEELRGADAELRDGEGLVQVQPEAARGDPHSAGVQPHLLGRPEHQRGRVVVRPDAGDRHRPAGRGGHGGRGHAAVGAGAEQPPHQLPVEGTGDAHRAGPHLRGPEARGGHLGAAARRPEGLEALVRGRGAQARQQEPPGPHGAAAVASREVASRRGPSAASPGSAPAATRSPTRQVPLGSAASATAAGPPKGRCGRGRAASGSSPSAAAPSLRGTPACMGHAPRHSAAALSAAGGRQGGRPEGRGGAAGCRRGRGSRRPQRDPEPVQGLDAGGPEEARRGAPPTGGGETDATSASGAESRRSVPSAESTTARPPLEEAAREPTGTAVPGCDQDIWMQRVWHLFRRTAAR